MFGEPLIVSGIGPLLNRDIITPGLDIDTAAKSFIDNNDKIQRPVDPVQVHKDEIAKIAKDLGISFGYSESAQPTASKQPSPPSMGGDGGGFAMHNDQDDKSDADSVSSAGSEDRMDDMANMSHSTVDQNGFHASSSAANQSQSYYQPQTSRPTDLHSRTNEQIRREQINSAIPMNNNVKFSLERERMEDEKSQMLAEIDQLLQILNECEIDITRIPKVSSSNSHDEIESVLRTLRFKNDHSRNCTVAEETILALVHGLESVFDGKNAFFGKRFDLRGYHNHALVKLRRTRHDTSRVVGQFMGNNGISPWTRIALEFIPSMLSYLMTNQHAYDEQELFSNTSLTTNNIRNSESKYNQK